MAGDRVSLSVSHVLQKCGELGLRFAGSDRFHGSTYPRISITPTLRVAAEPAAVRPAGRRRYDARLWLRCAFGGGFAVYEPPRFDLARHLGDRVIGAVAKGLEDRLLFGASGEDEA